MTIPARFVGIDHVVFRVTSVERTVTFYNDVLGLRVERIFDKIGLHQVRCGNNLIDLIGLKAGETLPPPQSRGIEHLCLSVEADLDELVEYLKAKGYPPFMGPMEVYGARGFGTSVYIRDPDGYEIELKVGYARTPVRFPPPAG
ncbi:VOC family protein [Bradyrhizobium sp. dw_78]|uniref:VOC family protein n=1 Tax=Bradyrhizobium sp. dw_78 TaxID=2719793 RepID=UPI001BD36B78|nr:VOC family protein [Bradyrhizobium sp. dw_78]